MPTRINVRAVSYAAPPLTEEPRETPRHGRQPLDAHGPLPEELWRDPACHEYSFTGGTCTVLDQLIDGPTHADWDAAPHSGRLDFPDRAQGRCTVLHVDGEPTQIGYWGVTADRRSFVPLVRPLAAGVSSPVQPGASRS